MKNTKIESIEDLGLIYGLREGRIPKPTISIHWNTVLKYHIRMAKILRKLLPL